MKNRILNIAKVLVVLVFLSYSKLSAQEVKVDEVIYKVENTVITKAGIDVTSTLSEAQKSKILNAAKAIRQQEDAEKEATQKKIEKAEKAQRKAEKKRKKAEKVLRQKEKAQSNYNKAIEKHKNAQQKYDKLKSKGKLSPVDEKKWLEKIEKLHSNIAKAKKKLK
ncbi:hypothetical protein [Hyunsoonleella ulvae]|uniref:hypothetical protein n=1 Tax=Hyunsoonleella ulvae TaxID=2799948 RepID=UPI00193A5A6C|nr:hypothetical protein [Hyunsoonleella ulvae]